MATEKDLWRLLNDLEEAIHEEAYVIEKDLHDFLPNVTQRTQDLLEALLKVCTELKIYPSNHTDLAHKLSAIAAQQEKNRSMLDDKSHIVKRKLKSLNACQYKLGAFRESYVNSLDYSIGNDRPNFFARG